MPVCRAAEAREQVPDKCLSIARTCPRQAASGRGVLKRQHFRDAAWSPLVQQHSSKITCSSYSNHIKASHSYNDLCPVRLSLCRGLKMLYIAIWLLLDTHTPFNLPIKLRQTGHTCRIALVPHACGIACQVVLPALACACLFVCVTPGPPHTQSYQTTRPTAISLNHRGQEVNG